MDMAGLMYEFGYGVTRDLDKAKEWRKKAAEGGNEMAKDWLKTH